MKLCPSVEYRNAEANMSRSALDVINHYLDGIKTLDLEKCMSTLSEDCKFHSPCVPPPTPHLLDGMAMIRPVFEYLFGAAFKQFKFTRLDVHQSADDPNYISVHAASEVLLGNGKTYGNDYAYFARVRDGKIVEFWEFFDTTRAVAAMTV